MVVNHAWGEGSSRILNSMIANPTPVFVTIEGMAHSSDPEEMTKVREFIITRLTLDFRVSVINLFFLIRFIENNRPLNTIYCEEW